jgi:hypothetical protein
MRYPIASCTEAGIAVSVFLIRVVVVLVAMASSFLLVAGLKNCV